MKKKINLPNKITIFRMIVVIIIIVLAILDTFGLAGKGFDIFNIHHTYISVLILVLFILGSISDFVDGHLARKYNLVTTFGKFMDPIADKLLVNTILIILTGIGQIHWIVPVIMIGRDIVVDAIRLIVVEQGGKVIAASMLGKLKTITQMIAIILILMLPNIEWITYLIYVPTIVSLISGCDYFIKHKDILLKDLRG